MRDSAQHNHDIAFITQFFKRSGTNANAPYKRALFQRLMNEFFKEEDNVDKNCNALPEPKPFSITDMKALMIDALKDVKSGGRPITNREDPLARQPDGHLLIVYDGFDTLGMYARDIPTKLHQDQQWANNCTFVWFAEAPAGANTGTTLQLDDKTYRLKPETLYYLNLSFPNGLMHAAPTIETLQNTFQARIFFTLEENNSYPPLVSKVDYAKWNVTEKPRGNVLVDRALLPPPYKLIQNRERYDDVLAFVEKTAYTDLPLTSETIAFLQSKFIMAIYDGTTFYEPTFVDNPDDLADQLRPHHPAIPANQLKEAAKTPSILLDLFAKQDLLDKIETPKPSLTVPSAPPGA